MTLATLTGLPLTVTGGMARGGTQSEAALMKSFIESELKHPVAMAEELSRDTRQNAEFIARELRLLRLKTVVLVTDVLHMPRARRAFEAAGVRVIPAPMAFEATGPLSLSDFLPSAQGIYLSAYVCHEMLGRVWYAVRRKAGDVSR